jgi:hypothetical protein
VRFRKEIALTARLLNAVTELPFVYVSLMLQLNAKFETVMWNNTTCDAVENYHVDGGSLFSQSDLTHYTSVRRHPDVLGISKCSEV